MNVDIEASPGGDCEAFVLARPEGNLAHTPRWHRMVVGASRNEGLYLVARRDGQVCGVLPMVHVRSRLFGNRMVSHGLSNYGGPLADGPETLDALYRRATELAAQRRCEHIEFRNLHPMPYDLPELENKVCMYLPLPADPEPLWDSLKAKVRNQVRKAEKSGIVSFCGGAELLEEFYGVYVTRMHQLGTPCYSRETFGLMMEGMGDLFRIFVVRKDDLAVGAGITCCFKGLAEIPYASTLVEFNSLCPNNLLYWSILKHYCQAGAKTFDFGRSTIDAGTYQFKKQWGAEPVALHYQFWLPEGGKLELANPDSPKYRRKVEMWKKLPAWLANWLGPKLSRSLP